jgi:hypothetical protein
MTTTSYLIAFLPWLRMKEPIAIGETGFFPFRNSVGELSPPLRDLGASLDTILSGYVDTNERPISNCVVVTMKGRTPAWALEDSAYHIVQRIRHFFFSPLFFRTTILPASAVMQTARCSNFTGSNSLNPFDPWLSISNAETDQRKSAGIDMEK